VSAIGAQRRVYDDGFRSKLTQEALCGRKVDSVAINKVNLFYEQGKFGWSEVYYRQNETLADTIKAAKRLATRRCEMNGDNTTLTYIRASVRDVQGDSEIDVETMSTGTQGKISVAAVNGASDSPWTAFLFRCEYDALHRRMLYARGVPDSSIGHDPENPRVPGTPVEEAITKFKKELVDGGWGSVFSIRSQVDNPSFPVTVLDIVSGHATVTATGHTYAARDTVFVQIKRLDGSRMSINALLTVPVANLLKFEWPVADIINEAVTGVARKRVYEFRPFAKVHLRKTTHRDTGRPFDSPRGRQSKK